MESILNCAMDIGEKMLTCGGEVHRVEDSITRIAIALGASRADVFIITSQMSATVFDGEGRSHTQTRRIKGGGTNIEKLHRLNALSRKICEQSLSFDDIQKELQEIEKKGSYHPAATVLAQAVIAAAFALFFGGGVLEATVAFFIGGVLRCVALLSDKAEINTIFSKFLCTAICTALAFCAVKLRLVPTIDNIMIGNIMALIPGIGFTNAMRDLFMGDSISGILRTIEAVLIALAIAAGYFTVAFAFGGAVI